MAELSLLPDPKLMTVQAGIFLTNVYIVKKLYVDPYMKLRDKRESLTEGNQDLASGLVKECDEKSLKIESSLKEAYEEAKTEASIIRENARSQVEGILKEANQVAKSKMDATATAIGAMVSEEKEKIPQLVSNLTDEMYAKLLN